MPWGNRRRSGKKGWEEALRWVLDRVRRHVAGLTSVDCGTVAEGVPYEKIAGDIPGINDVANC